MLTIYSKPSCPQCDQAKTLVKQNGLAYKEVMLDVGQPKVDGVEYITRDGLLSLIPNARMMPQVMREAEHIGSLPELRKWLTAAAK